ncbi:HipA family kinase [Cypionkella sp. TWP1-2-1b2]|uniref:HipA family kinase n=1 Tax=Cypionkella sp. TWP1-2-1b2 TaxID=2804675 RepID=UPI003CF05F03
MQVSEILRRSEQGVTQPFVCRGRDGNVYFAKGRNLTRKGLVAEYVSAELAELFGVPTLEHTILNVPRELVVVSSEWRLKDLGPGPVFKTLAAAHLSEIDINTAKNVDQAVRKNVAVFDFWIGNGDRSLTEFGGNPNLFIDLSDGSLVVIDHNLAFDYEMSLVRQLELHVFRDDLRLAAGSASERSLYAGKMATCLQDWPRIVASIPDEWYYLDDEMTEPAILDLARMKTWLERLSMNEWN